MKIQIPHHTTRLKARKKVNDLLTDVAEEHAHMVKDLQQSWDGDVLSFQFKAAGFKASGTLEVTDKELLVEGHLPLLARAFEPKIAHAIEKEAGKHFKVSKKA
jgi:hypothetical protein